MVSRVRRPAQRTAASPCRRRARAAWCRATTVTCPTTTSRPGTTAGAGAGPARARGWSRPRRRRASAHPTRPRRRTCSRAGTRSRRSASRRRRSGSTPRRRRWGWCWPARCPTLSPATHSDADGQVIVWTTLGAPSGASTVTGEPHVPLTGLVEVTIAPLASPATHSVVVGHEIGIERTHPPRCPPSRRPRRPSGWWSAVRSRCRRRRRTASSPGTTTPGSASPSAMSAVLQADAPPVGSVEVSTSPVESVATHRLVDGHDTAIRVASGSTETDCHADVPPPGLVECRTLPTWSTATHSLVDGHEIAVSPLPLSMAAGRPPALADARERSNAAGCRWRPRRSTGWPRGRRSPRRPRPRRSRARVDTHARRGPGRAGAGDHVAVGVGARAEVRARAGDPVERRGVGAGRRRPRRCAARRDCRRTGRCPTSSPAAQKPVGAHDTESRPAAPSIGATGHPAVVGVAPGVVETSALPSSSTATHSDADAHETASKVAPGSTAAPAHAPAPPVGLVDLQQRAAAVDGHAQGGRGARHGGEGVGAVDRRAGPRWWRRRRGRSTSRRCRTGRRRCTQTPRGTRSRSAGWR